MAVATQYATGRRKCAIARAWVTGTAGDITVNEKPLEKAFPRLTLRQIIQLPLEMAGVMGKYSISATVYGGGPAGQAGALRHAIARALVNDPAIIVADEPTGNLDERATRGVFQLIREINAGGTAVVMATHDLDLVKQTTYRTVELREGTVVFDSGVDDGEESEE